MLARLTRSAWWNWAWFLLGIVPCGVFAYHVDYGNVWVKWSLLVIVITWIVPSKTPRLRPWRCAGCGERILPGQGTVNRTRGQDGRVCWVKHMECWQREQADR